MATKKNKSNFDDDSYVNLMFGLGAAKRIGDTETLNRVKQAHPKEYAEFEAAEKASAKPRGTKKSAPAKKTGKK